MVSAAQVLRSVQCWPVKHGLTSLEVKSHVGWTQLKLMLAVAMPARALIPKMVALILKDVLQIASKPMI
jgi:hypothetical protein